MVNAFHTFMDSPTPPHTDARGVGSALNGDYFSKITGNRQSFNIPQPHIPLKIRTFLRAGVRHTETPLRLIRRIREVLGFENHLGEIGMIAQIQDCELVGLGFVIDSQFVLSFSK